MTTGNREEQSHRLQECSSYAASKAYKQDNAAAAAAKGVHGENCTTRADHKELTIRSSLIALDSSMVLHSLEVLSIACDASHTRYQPSSNHFWVLS